MAIGKGKTEQLRSIAGYLDFLLELAQNPQVANEVGTREKAARRRNAWTHAFVCLRKKSQFCLPSPQERYELKCTGLGEKKITIEMENKGFEELYRVLLEEFPLLSNAGGIDLMRTGFGPNSKTLEVIPVPHGSSTYTIQYLKEVLQQAKCYVRPIQRDLPKPTIDVTDSTDDAAFVSIE